MRRLVLPSILAPILCAPLVATGCSSLLGIEDLSPGPDAGDPPDAKPAVDAGLADAGEMDASEPGFTFDLLTTNPTLPLDGTTFLDVEIRRRGGFTGAVTVMPASLPTGLAAEAVLISEDQSRVEFPVGARAPLAIGDTLSFELVASATGLPEQSRSVDEAEVTGRPGLLDITFGPDATGLVTVSFGADDCGRFYDLEITGDQKILAAGWGCGGLGGSTSALARLLPDGQRDPSFGDNGLVRTSYGTGSTAESFDTYAVGRQVDGRIIAIGHHESTSSFPPELALVRYTTSGAEGDPLFGNYTAGKSRISLGATPEAEENITDGLVTADSRILAAGDLDGRLVVARATPLGELDTSFADGDGFVLLTSGDASRAESMVTDLQNRLVMAGFIDIDGQRDMVLVRMSEDGELDPSFGPDGTGVIVAGDGDAAEHAVAVAVRPDGRIVVAGHADTGSGLDLQIRQFLEDGSPDLDFGTQGVSTQAISDEDDRASDMTLTPDGRIMVIGNQTSGSDRGPFVTRFTRDGALDLYFDGDGVLPLFIGDAGAVEAIELFGNSKVLISGGDEGGSPGPGTFGVVVRLWI